MTKLCVLTYKVLIAAITQLYCNHTDISLIIAATPLSSRDPRRGQSTTRCNLQCKPSLPYTTRYTDRSLY